MLIYLSFCVGRGCRGGTFYRREDSEVGVQGPLVRSRIQGAFHVLRADMPACSHLLYDADPAFRRNSATFPYYRQHVDHNQYCYPLSLMYSSIVDRKAGKMERQWKSNIIN